EYGNPTSVVELHEKMNEKRFKKSEFIREELNFIRRYGPPDAEIGAIGWGSSKGAIKEAVLKLNDEGYKVSAIIPQIIYPLPFKKFEEFLAPLKKAIIFELSYTAQFLKYLRSHFDLPLKPILYKRSGATPFTVEEIYNKIKSELERR
ncbi:MAG: hypothetical protein ACE5QV_08205, partial [Fidelibacterota bacterium]